MRLIGLTIRYIYIHNGKLDSKFLKMHFRGEAHSVVVVNKNKKKKIENSVEYCTS